jgi:hypothetical protein
LGESTLPSRSNVVPVNLPFFVLCLWVTGYGTLEWQPGEIRLMVYASAASMNVADGLCHEQRFLKSLGKEGRGAGLVFVFSLLPIWCGCDFGRKAMPA